MTNELPDELVNGAIVRASGYYWHYDDTSNRAIWRARLSVDPEGEVHKRHRVPSRAHDGLRHLWLQRGELPEVGTFRAGSAMRAKVKKMDEDEYFKHVDSGEPTWPYVCVLCGCFVAIEFGVRHRNQCQVSA